MGKHSVPASVRGRGAENAGVEIAGVEMQGSDKVWKAVKTENS